MGKTLLRTKRWLAVFAWVAAIYGTLSVMPDVVFFIREYVSMNLVIGVCFAAMMLFFTLWVCRSGCIERKSSYVYLLGMLIAYIFVYWWLAIPQERMHLVQYGGLAMLIYWALGLDLQGWKRYGLAFVFASAFGWGDELIQGVLPNRYYELMDVMINALSTFMALVVVYLIKRTY